MDSRVGSLWYRALRIFAPVPPKGICIPGCRLYRSVSERVDPPKRTICRPPSAKEKTTSRFFPENSSPESNLVKFDQLGVRPNRFQNRFVPYAPFVDLIIGFEDMVQFVGFDPTPVSSTDRCNMAGPGGCIQTRCNGDSTFRGILEGIGQQIEDDFLDILR